MATPNFTAEELRLIVSYDQKTGEFRWLANRGGTARAGSVAGTRRKDGYKSIIIGNKHFYAHRLAWYYCYGVWPELHVDHIDGDPSNNSIANLRLATHAENLRNRIKQSRRNKSGFRGVSRCKSNGYWRADIVVNRQQISLGRFKDKMAAALAFEEAAKKYFGEFFKPTIQGY